MKTDREMHIASAVGFFVFFDACIFARLMDH